MIWTDGLPQGYPHLSGLLHLPGALHLHENSSLDDGVWIASVNTLYYSSLSKRNYVKELPFILLTIS